MFRGVCTVLALLSLLLLAAAAGLWARSYGVRDSLRVRTAEGPVGVISTRGAIGVGWGARRGRPMSQSWEYTQRRPNDLASASAFYRELYGIPGVAAFHQGPGRFMPWRRFLVVHDVFLVLPFSVLPAWWLIRVAGRRRPGRACPECGHWLSATPAVCPECGCAVGARLSRQPSAAGPVLRVSLVMLGILAFCLWAWDASGSDRKKDQRYSQPDPITAKVWQDVQRLH